MKSLKHYWLKVPVKVRVELVSAFHTFVATFLATVAFQLQQANVNWSSDFLLSILIAAIRSGVKATMYGGYGIQKIQE